LPILFDRLKTLAYYGIEIITAAKSFIVLGLDIFEMYVGLYSQQNVLINYIKN